MLDGEGSLIWPGGKGKPSAVQEKQRGEKTEFQCDTKELEGMHQRKVFEIKSRQVHKDELREQPVSQETANGDSYIRKESEPPRKRKLSLCLELFPVNTQ